MYEESLRFHLVNMLAEDLTKKLPLIIRRLKLVTAMFYDWNFYDLSLQQEKEELLRYYLLSLASLCSYIFLGDWRDTKITTGPFIFSSRWLSQL